MEKNKKIVSVDCDYESKSVGMFYFVNIKQSEKDFNSREIRKELFDMFKEEHGIESEYDITLCNSSKTKMIIDDDVIKVYRFMFRCKLVYRK